MEKRIKQFFRVPRPNVRLTILHQVFLAENKGINISYSQFTRIANRVTSVRTIRTGGAEISLKKMANVLVDRAFRSISMLNTISIDEKPIVIKNYLIKSARVLKSHKGALYKSMLYGIKMNPFYLIAAVTKDGLLCYRLYDNPIHKEEFEGFIAHISINYSAEEKQFLLFDNATFHKVCDECLDILNENGFEITNTPPSGCFLDPIEEFFGIFDTIFREKYQKAIVETGNFNPLSRSEIRDIIIVALQEANRNLRNQYIRAMLY